MIDSVIDDIANRLEEPDFEEKDLLPSPLLNDLPPTIWNQWHNFVIKTLLETRAMKVLLLDTEGRLIFSKVDEKNLNQQTAREKFAEIIKERGYFVGSTRFLNPSIYISIIAKSLIVAVLFDGNSSMGLVRKYFRENKTIIDAMQI